MTKPIVAIVGRPNVGKSTLFNRLSGERRAIVGRSPGITRDRLYADIWWKGCEFVVVDTGGLELKPQSTLRQMVCRQIEIAIAEAKVIIFLTDGRDGVLPPDAEIADMLRQASKKIVLAINKIDSHGLESEVFQFYQLGMGDPVPISAYHDRGIDALLDRIISYLPLASTATTPQAMMKVAIVGRPNVGKSMLLNRLLGEERVIVDEAPGTTRDAIDTTFHSNGESLVLIDTAGIRRRGRIEKGVETYSLIRVRNAIDRADVALVVTDAAEGIAAQDIHLLGYVQQAYCGAILIVNKWDQVSIKDTTQWAKFIKQKIKFMPYISILFISAKTGYGVGKVLPAAKVIYHERFRSPPQLLLEGVVKEAVAAHPPPMKGGKRLLISRATQVGVNPPAFVFGVNDAKLVHFSYRRYLENRLRQSFGFEGTPLRLEFSKQCGGKQCLNSLPLFS